MGGESPCAEEPVHVLSPLERRPHVASTLIHRRAPSGTTVRRERQTPLFEPGVTPRHPAGVAFRLPLARPGPARAPVRRHPLAPAALLASEAGLSPGLAYPPQSACAEQAFGSVAGQ